MGFRKKLFSSAEKNKSRLILSLDYGVQPTESESWKEAIQKAYKRSMETFDLLKDKIAGVKVNRHLVLPLGLFSEEFGVMKMVSHFHSSGIPVIMDAKINDIGNTNRWISNYYFEAGFDAIICNPFVGLEGGLEDVFVEARKRDRGVILLSLMSHPASIYGYQRLAFAKEGELLFYKIFADAAKEWGADAVIAGATYPEKIMTIRQRVGSEVMIISPGIGAQGGSVEEAIMNGTDFCIVGRSLIFADDPLETADEYNRKILSTLKKRPKFE